MCGALVIDNEGDVFGHIVAADPAANTAFIIPAYKVFTDLRTRFVSVTFAPPEPLPAQTPTAAFQELDDAGRRGQGFRQDAVASCRRHDSNWRDRLPFDIAERITEARRDAEALKTRIAALRQPVSNRVDQSQSHDFDRKELFQKRISRIHSVKPRTKHELELIPTPLDLSTISGIIHLTNLIVNLSPSYQKWISPKAAHGRDESSMRNATDGALQIWQAARATAAAPFHFTPSEFHSGIDHDLIPFKDGGIEFPNPGGPHQRSHYDTSTNSEALDACLPKKGTQKSLPLSKASNIFNSSPLVGNSEQDSSWESRSDQDVRFENLLSHDVHQYAALSHTWGWSDSQSRQHRRYSDGVICTVGTGARSPTTNNTEEFWKLLCRNTGSKTEEPEHAKANARSHFDYEDIVYQFLGNHCFEISPVQSLYLQNTGTNIEDSEYAMAEANYNMDYDGFDKRFFKTSPVQNAAMDPQQRIMLETSYQALMDSGLIDPLQYCNAGDILEYGQRPGAGQEDRMSPKHIPPRTQRKRRHSEPARRRLKCDACNKQPEGFRSPHELRRHQVSAHGMLPRCTVCVNTRRNAVSTRSCSQRHVGFYDEHHDPSAVERSEKSKHCIGQPMEADDENRGGIYPPMERFADHECHCRCPPCRAGSCKIARIHR